MSGQAGRQCRPFMLWRHPYSTGRIALTYVGWRTGCRTNFTAWGGPSRSLTLPAFSPTDNTLQHGFSLTPFHPLTFHRATTCQTLPSPTCLALPLPHHEGHFHGSQATFSPFLQRCRTARATDVTTQDRARGRRTASCNATTTSSAFCTTRCAWPAQLHMAAGAPWMAHF